VGLAIHWVDAVIVVLYLAGVVGFGLWVSRGRKDLANYLVGGRDMPWWAVLGSLVATETSTATFLSVPGIAFAANGDMRFLQLAIGYILGRTVVTMLLLPQYFGGQLLSAYEVLGKRFGRDTQRLSAVVFLITRNLGDGLRLFLTAIVLQQVAGFSLPICIILIGILTIIYTCIGGMTAVVWNDCVQLLVYVAGGLLALLMIIKFLPGGWGELAAFAEANDKFRLIDFGWDLSDAYTFWAGLIGGAFLTIGTHGTDQMMVQRCLSARSERDAGIAMILSGFVVFVQFALFLLLGVALACFYTNVAPEQTFDRNDEVLATFIVTRLPVGVVGITLAAVFAAAMSTLSSSLNSSASSAMNDLLQPSADKSDPDGRLVSISRRLTILFGIIQIGIGIAAASLSRSVVTDALGIAGFSAGILLGAFSLALFNRRANQPGTIVGMLAGAVVLLVIKFATPISWPWYTLLGAVSTFVTGSLWSLLSSGKPTGQRIPPGA